MKRKAYHPPKFKLGLAASPNSQNDRYCALVNPQEIVQCKKARGSKVMALVGIINEHLLPVFWSIGSVNEEVYLKQVYKGTGSLAHST